LFQHRARNRGRASVEVTPTSGSTSRCDPGEVQIVPFRDDEEARLARLASLENENEHLRAELDGNRRANAELAAERERLAREKPFDTDPARTSVPAPAAAELEAAERRPASRDRRDGQSRWIRRAPRVLAIVAAVAAIAVLIRCGIK